MLLLIDIGNSNIVFCLYDISKKQVIIKYRIVTYSYKNIIKVLYNINNSYIILYYIMISSVVPKINKYLVLNIKYFFKNSIIHFFNDKNINIFINTLYDNNIGSDRIVNCIGAIDKFPKKNLLIIDIGTIITFDLITKQKQHLGGVIFPGIHSIIKSIYKNSDKLKKYNFNNQYYDMLSLSCLQTTTINNINIGTYYGCIGAIKEIIKNISYNFKEKFFVIGTGGNADIFENENIFDTIENNLIFLGLLKFYKICVQ